MPRIIHKSIRHWYAVARNSWKSWRQSTAFRCGIKTQYGILRSLNNQEYHWRIEPNGNLSELDVVLRPNTTDRGVFNEILIQEAYSLSFKPFLTLLQSGTPLTSYPIGNYLIIDCGANIGLSSLYFHLRFPKAKVIAVEADIHNFRHLAAQPFTRHIFPIHAAISNQAETLSVSRNEYGEWGTRVLQQSGSDVVQSITINDLYYQHSASHIPFLVKIDIEGFEEHLFQSNLEWLDITPIVVIELHDWMFPEKAVSRNFLQTIASRNRLIVTRNEHIWVISPELLRQAIDTEFSK